MTSLYGFLPRTQKIHRHLFDCDTIFKNVLQKRNRTTRQSYLSKGCWVKRKDSGPSHVLSWRFHSMGSLIKRNPPKSITEKQTDVPFPDSKITVFLATLLTATVSSLVKHFYVIHA